MKVLLECIFGHQRRLPLAWRVILWLILAGFGYVYFTAALAHGRTHNPIYIDDEGKDDYHNDQGVYMKGALAMPGTSFQHFNPRMRMPMYEWLLGLAALTQKDTSDSTQNLRHFFSVAKKFSIGLSLVLLAAMFFGLRRWLGNWVGLCFTAIAGVQVFMLRAPYVQPELTLTAFITVSVAWLAYTLHRPTWYNGLISGLLLCGWFLTKASAQIGFGLFGAFLCLKWLLAPRGQKMACILCGITTVAGYLLPMSPYLWTSYATFGDPFYNVQGKYYMWATDVDEKHFLQKTGLDRNLDYIKGHPEHLAELPSAAKYWKEHPWRTPPNSKNPHDLKTVGIVDRLFHGVYMMFNAAFDEYVGFYFMIAIWAGFVLWAMSTYWADASRDLWTFKWELLFAITLVTTFAFLFGWFVPIKAGPRLINSAALIPLFFATAMTHRLIRDKTITWCGSVLSVERLVATAFLLFWAAFSLFQIPRELKFGYFGG